MEKNRLFDVQDSDSEELSDRDVGPCNCLRRFSWSKGILSALCATFILTGGDICAKLLTQSMSPVAVIATYSFISAAVSLIFTAALKVPIPCLRTILLALLPCTVVSCACRFFLVGSINRLPVGDAISIFYTTPMFAAFLGWILLKQSLKMSDILFSFTSIVGVVFITRPSFLFGQITNHVSDIDPFGIMFSIGGAVCNALYVIGVRKCTDLGVHYAVIVATTQSTLFIINAPVCTFAGGWKFPEPPYYTAFIPLYAICILTASFCIFHAVAKERAVYVTVILTLEIILVYAFQSIAMSAAPHWLTITGAMAIIVSCVGMAFRETREVDD